MKYFTIHVIKSYKKSKKSESLQLFSQSKQVDLVYLSGLMMTLRIPFLLVFTFQFALLIITFVFLTTFSFLAYVDTCNHMS